MKYNINNNNLDKIFLLIAKELEKSSEILEELIKLDNKHDKIKINLNEIKQVLEILKNEKIEIQEEQKILIEYNGNPYTTLNLGLLAILTKTTIFLEFNQSVLGVNTFILKILNEVLNNFQTEPLIYMCAKSKIDDKEIDKIICIDDIYKYNSYLRKQNTKVRFYALNYIDFYSDTNEFDDLTELVYKYAENNEIPIESYSELDVTEAVQMIKNGLGKSVIILTNNEENKRLFADNIKNKKIYINQNPYKQEITIINKEIFYI